MPSESPEHKLLQMYVLQRGEKLHEVILYNRICISLENATVTEKREVSLLFEKELT